MDGIPEKHTESAGNSGRRARSRVVQCGGLNMVGGCGCCGGYSVWRIATEPNRNSAILAIHIPLNTAYVSVSTEPPDCNHDN